MIPLRRLLGGVLRRQRQRQGRTLREVSAAARVSLGYLSEVERGQKEPSSELFAAICQALEVPMSKVLREVSDELALVESGAATPSGKGGSTSAASAVPSAPVPTQTDSAIATTSAERASARATAVHDLVTSAPFDPPMPTPMPGDGVVVDVAA